MVIQTIKLVKFMDASKIDLNAPAFGEGAQKVEDLVPETEVKEPIDQPIIEPVGAKKDDDDGEPESVVPYRRFKKFHDRALQAEQEAAEWRAKAEATNNRQAEPQIDYQDEAFKLWIENFGDNEASRKAWVNQLKIQEQLEQRSLERASQKALEAVRNERQAEENRTEQNIDLIDDQLDELQAEVGRALTEKEQAELLDIVDDYTPKDGNGDYAGAMMPFNKAWEIYQLKKQSSKAPKVQSRNAVAQLSANQTQGETSVQTEKDKNFNPLDWDAYRNRI
jgi:hypothetical protein